MTLLHGSNRLRRLFCAAAALLFLCGGCGQEASPASTPQEDTTSAAASLTEGEKNSTSAASDAASEAGVFSREASGNAGSFGSAETAGGETESAAPPETADNAEDVTGEATSESSAEPEEPEEPTWVLTPVEEAYTVYCTGAAVNLRTEPAVSGEIVGTVSNGDALACTGTVDNGWLQVQYGSDVLYVYGDYFSTEKPVVIDSDDGSAASSVEFETQSGVGLYYEGSGPLVAIDAGHQETPDSSEEPIGPGATTTKAKVAAGTVGVSSGVPEYELTLQVSLRLRDALLEKGYAVLMIRETNDVSISNAERAQLANSYDADIFLRIHANAVDASSATGTLTMAPSLDNPYCGEIAEESQILSQLLVDDMCAETGFRNRGVSLTDTMSGINWCEMPVSIIELGFMSNAKEDEAMQTAEVQQQLVNGMAKAVDEFFDR